MYKLKRWGGVMIIILLLLLLASETVADKQNIHDGYWWKDNTEIFKVGYIMGFAKGWANMRNLMKIVISDYPMCYKDKESGEYIPVSPDLDSDILLGVDMDVLIGVDGWIYGVKYGDMVDGLDHLYSDHRNRNIEISRALEIVCREISRFFISWY